MDIDPKNNLDSVNLISEKHFDMISKGYFDFGNLLSIPAAIDWFNNLKNNGYQQHI